MLSLLFLMTVIGLPWCFGILSLSCCVDESTLSSMLSSHLPPSFLETYSLLTSSLGCYVLWVFSSVLTDTLIFHWRLGDCESPQFSRPLLTILAVFNNPVLWMVSTRPPISNFYSSFNNPLVTVPKASLTIGQIVTFMFHSFFFFQFLSKVKLLILLFTFF